jgi:3-oxoacyl-[acyl-carrier protein] reductase
MPFRFKSVIS